MRNRPTTVSIILAGALAAAPSFAPAQDGGGWTTYRNERFGTTIDYPAALFSLRSPPPTNGDGREFQTADRRASLRVWGGWNIDSDTPEAYVSKYGKEEGETVDYMRATKSFFVRSGLRSGRIFYERCNFSAVPDGIRNCFEVVYPRGEKARWDAIVTRLGQSLRAGKGYEKQ